MVGSKVHFVVQKFTLGFMNGTRTQESIELRGNIRGSKPHSGVQGWNPNPRLYKSLMIGFHGIRKIFDRPIISQDLEHLIKQSKQRAVPFIAPRKEYIYIYV